MEDEENISPDPIDYADQFGETEEVVEEVEDEVIDYADQFGEEECLCGTDDSGNCLECEEEEEEVVEEKEPASEEAGSAVSMIEDVADKAIDKGWESRPKASDDISYTDFNTPGEGTFDDAEERLEDKLAIQYPHLKFDTPMMSSGYMYDRLDVTAPNGEVFTWDMNTDYNARKKGVTDPKARQEYGQKKYLEFLKFANKHKFNEKGEYTDPKYRRTLGPDYMTVDDYGNEVEMEVTPGITQKALMLMEQDPTILDMNEAITKAAQSEYGQMNIAWQNNLNSKEAEANVTIMNGVKALVRDEDFNPNLVGERYNAYDENGALNQQINDLIKIGMPSSVVNKDIQWIKEGAAELKKLSKLSAREQEGRTDEAASWAFSMEQAQRDIKKNINAWLAGSEKWGENKLGPLVLQAYNSEKQAIAAKKEEEELDKKVEDHDWSEDEVKEYIALTNKIITDSEGSDGKATISEDEAKSYAQAIMQDKIAQKIVTTETSDIAEKILKAEYDGNEEVSSLIALREKIDTIEDPEERAKARKEFLALVQDFLGNDKVSLLRNPDGSFVDPVKQKQSEDAKARNKSMKAQVAEALTMPNDELLKRIKEVNTELSVLTSDILKKGRTEILRETSLL